MKWIAVIACLIPQLSFAGELLIKDSWIPHAPPIAKAHAAYGSIVNTGTDPITIISVKAEGYAMTHLHATTEENSVSSMVPVHQIEIPSGEQVELMPGGMHLMLMRPENPKSPGDTVTLIFELGNGQSINAIATVRERDAAS